MSTYQRYLRERKEVQFEEQELEEQPVKGIGDVTNRPRVRGKQSRENPTAPAAPAAKPTKTPAQSALAAALNAPAAPTTTTDAVASKKDKQQQALKGLMSKKVDTLTQNEIDQIRNLSSKLGQSVPDSINKRERDLKKSGSAIAKDTIPADPDASGSITRGSGGQIAGNNITEVLSSAGVSNPRTIQRVKQAFVKAARELGVKIKPGFEA